MTYDELALCEEIAELDHLYGTASFGVCLTDRNHRYVRINQLLADINGKPVAEHLGRTVEEVIPHIAPQLIAVFEHVIQTGEPAQEYEVRGPIHAKPGDERVFVVSHHPLKSEFGDVHFVSTIFRDITDSKRAEEELQRAHDDLERLVQERTLELTEANTTLKDEITERKMIQEKMQASEVRLLQLLESTSAVPWEADATTWEFTYVGPSVVNLLGYEVDRWYEKDFWPSHIHPDDRAYAIDVCEASSRRLEEYQFEYRMIAADGTDIWIRDIVSVVAGDGVPKTLRGFMINITGLRRSQHALSERLQFETAVADLSRQFIETSANEMDEQLTQTLAAAAQNLAADRCAIHQWTSSERELRVTHQWCAPEFEKYGDLPEKPGPDQSSWFDGKIDDGQTMVVNTVSDLPPEHRDERRLCEASGLQSLVVVPLATGETTLGTFSVGCIGEKRVWSQEAIQRIRLLADIVASALGRQRYEQELKRSFDEVKELKKQLEQDNTYLRDEFKLFYDQGNIIGESEAIKKVLKQMEDVAVTDSTVLVLGETGTGKELVARALHNMSSRNGKTMVTVNCAALPATLIESELFGREKGAYTGALSKQVGRFEVADGSTIFLDEVSELPLELQAKLLRVLEHGEFERLGSSQTITSDVRIIAASNRDLEKEVCEGRFREDLFYRLNVFPISIPPLRERAEDIPVLTWSFINELSDKMGKRVDSVSKRTMEDLQRYRWPGNVRELHNVIEHGIILSKNKKLEVELPCSSKSPAIADLTLTAVERLHILSVLETCRWRVRGEQGAAALLGLNEGTLRSRMKKLDIQRPTKA